MKESAAIGAILHCIYAINVGVIKDNTCFQ